MTNEEAILNLETIFAKYKFSEEESKSILKSFSVLFHNPVGAPLTLEQLYEMEGEKVILYRMKSTEPLEPGTVKRNGDVLGDFGMLAYHELYLETWVAFSYHFFDSAVTYMEGNSPTKTFNGKTAEELWLELGDVPMNPETERIEISWLGFPAGTHREDIWHWFEKTFNIAVYDLMYK